MDAPAKPSCARCSHWHTDDTAPHLAAVGKCRRFPPVALSDFQTIFPRTLPSSVCGEFALDANRAEASAKETQTQADALTRINEARVEAERSTKEAALKPEVTVTQAPSVKLDLPSGHIPKNPPDITIEQAKRFAARRVPVT